jgi:hypothetical protein
VVSPMAIAAQVVLIPTWVGVVRWVLSPSPGWP